MFYLARVNDAHSTVMCSYEYNPKCKKNGERTNNYKYFNKRSVYTAKIVKIINLFVSTVARNSGNCNLIIHIGCYDCIVNYNPITAISIILILSIRYTKKQNNILIKSF